MTLDILSIAPHEVSRDLGGYTILFYGAPKTGKTTIASHFPGALLLAFEVGYLAIPGIKAQPITKWSEFKQVLKQLDSPEAHELYQTIVVDTVDICYDLCEKYICNANSVSSIGDMPFGKGYAAAKKEFDEALRRIPQMGYGLVMISHDQDKVFKDEDGKEYNQIVPTLGNQPRLVVDRMSDVIGYARPFQEDDGTTKTLLFLRGTPRFIAGSRFEYTPEYIEFTYENLVNAIHDAVDKLATQYGSSAITDEKSSAHIPEPEINFDAEMKTFNDIVAKLQEAGGGAFGTLYAPRIQEIVQKHLGAGKTVTEMSRNQGEQLVLINDDLKEWVGNGI